MRRSLTFRWKTTGSKLCEKNKCHLLVIYDNDKTVIDKLLKEHKAITDHMDGHVERFTNQSWTVLGRILFHHSCWGITKSAVQYDIEKLFRHYPTNVLNHV